MVADQIVLQSAQIWDWHFFLISICTLMAILFIQEYRKHEKIEFKQLRKYTWVFWFFNILYIVIGAVIATFFGMIFNSSNPYSAIFYASSWEAIFSNLIHNKTKEVS